MQIWIKVQIRLLLTKFDINSTILVTSKLKLVDFEINKCPGKKVSKSRYRDASRRLSNAALGNHSLATAFATVLSG